MEKLNYKVQSVILVVWIFVVMAIFKVIPEKQMASLIAGSGFIIWPVLFLIHEFKSARNKIHIFTNILFLAAAALPIFLLRVMNLGSEFSTLSILGVPAAELHKYSNFFYILVLISALYYWLSPRFLRSK